MNMDLTTKEQKHFDTLVANAERNKVEAQQLALDAGKLLTVTKERLDDYKDSGFFKRCWYKISGKHGELDRANQKDLIEMQKYAWVYLMKLQEQNLIQAQAIAIIRNNLKDIVDEVAEIHEMISAIVEKFDERVTRLEKVTELQDWLLHIEVNDSIVQDSRCICVLQLTFDYLAVLRKNGIDYEAIERRDDLKGAMKKFGVSPYESMTVDAFVSQLFNEIQSFGYKVFRKIISLSVNGTEIDSKYILDNVSGAGYNALYRFEHEMDRMENMAKHLEKDSPQEVMLAAIRSVLNNPDTEYSILELAKEILCGSLLTEEIFKDENGIIVQNEPSSELNGSAFSLESLFGEHVAITSHAFLRDSPTQEEKLCYIESFSLLFAGLGGIVERQRHYISAISRLFECENCLERIELLARNSKRIDIKSIIAMLSTRERQYAWIIDAMHMGNCGSTVNPQAKIAIAQISTMGFNFKENEISLFLDNAEKLSTEKDPVALFQAIREINCKTEAWKTILDFNRLSLKGAFDDIRKRLNTISWAGSKLSLEITSAKMSLIDCSFSFGDENFLERTALSVSRSCCISKFKEQKSATKKFKDSARDVISDVNGILSMFGTETINYSDSLYNINADEATSVSNENWGNNMEFAFDKLDDFLNQINNVLSLQKSQLALYEEGKYHESAVENNKRREQNAKEKKEEEKKKKKSVTLANGDSSASLSFKFEKVDDLPFDFEDIETVISDGEAWFVLAKQLWTSKDGRSWSKIETPEDDVSNMKLRYINSTFILWKTYQPAYFYSTDGESWATGNFPESSSNEEIFFTGDKWYLQSCTYVSYSYVKEGIIWDSNETGSYNATELYMTSNLSDKWEKLDSKFNLSEGVYIATGALAGIADKLLAICAYDYFYRNNKHITNKGAHFVYSLNNKGWQNASFPVEVFNESDTIAREVPGRFLNTKNGIICASSKGIFLSSDGKSWEKTTDDFTFHSPSFLVLGNLTCIYNMNSERLCVSADGRQFYELLLEHRPESMASIKDTIVLADTSKSNGGVFIGTVHLSKS